MKNIYESWTKNIHSQICSGTIGTQVEEYYLLNPANKMGHSRVNYHKH